MWVQLTLCVQNSAYFILVSTALQLWKKIQVSHTFDFVVRFFVFSGQCFCAFLKQ